MQEACLKMCVLCARSEGERKSSIHVMLLFWTRFASKPWYIL